MNKYQIILDELCRILAVDPDDITQAHIELFEYLRDEIDDYDVWEEFCRLEGFAPFSRSHRILKPFG